MVIDFAFFVLLVPVEFVACIAVGAFVGAREAAKNVKDTFTDFLA
jgi:uncharacterized protein YneF (UPF0154 family)